MAGRLIIISNRIPTNEHLSGGLVVALHDALACTDAVWIGAHPDPGDNIEELEELIGSKYQKFAFRLTEEEIQNYYLGYANSVIWPLCHRRGDLVDMRSEYQSAYLKVNARIARLVATQLEPDDIIWAHDYHFLPLAAGMRELGVKNRIGFFLHIPFPALGDLSVLSKPETFAADLAQFDLIGLQTRSDVARCLEMFRADPRAEFLPDGSVKFNDRVTSVRSFPIGIDTAGFASEACHAGLPVFGRETPEEYIIGVDRLDYSKGLPNRFRAFSKYLETRPLGRKPCLVQIAPPTRQQVRAYQDITRELEEIAGHVNGTFAELDWTPVRYIHRSVPRARLARLYRQAKACLVTSLADGMNLVAKEYIAAQNPDDPGVLILSRFAGVAEDMTEALLINPYDIEDIAKAIAIAMDMPLSERKERHAASLRIVEATDVSTWSKNFLRVLKERPISVDFSRYFADV
ncbi:alpha,alpha-trehalose-phosphate synthase (UDP-forming) [Paracoccus laeviglucosivorans]|uniref:Trehalose 6-phosphate synthase n=1 Tax=Paracoccus laeviglucosivorans TaxID=1197861 RepID=A0A521FQS5_9RHOB|nr:trehalose-6-phosphate synthase [Paracoccus laeviglucosivorans]SMO98543.1 trehalose 6-phosphate synthase [Paracoccus laeviglucosivorans]